ncbi:MAG: glycosyltransferase family 9 protein [Limisphaerales bacterium]
MNTLILKLGATGDVVRTTPLLLTRFRDDVSWITADKNLPLLKNLRQNLRCVSWENREIVCDKKYDLVINLEDTLDVAQFLKTIRFKNLFGAYANANDELLYTDDSRGWFDLSLISRFGRNNADKLKFQNRRTYQELIFHGLGFPFLDEPYFLPKPTKTDLSGDVAISPAAGPVWPMKNWTYYDDLKSELEREGLTVNVLPKRATLLEHLGDVRNHRVLVGGDSLPMHFALGVGVRCVTVFTCTSPWEIHDYGLQRKIISPLLEQFFYQRGFDERATTAISVEEVFEATLEQLQSPVEMAHEQLQKF